MATNIDLHVHSTYSDGGMTPYEIIDEAVKFKVKYISITDHDSIDAYLSDVIKYAKHNNITLIPGVEMSTKLNTDFHIVGLNIDINNVELKNTLKCLKNARVDYLKNVSVKLKELGYSVDVDALLDLPSVTKAHIATQIVKNPLNHKLLMTNFGYIPSMGEFIETLMNEGCSAYIAKFSITPMEASKVIHNAGGKVILAHPVAYVHEDNLTVDEIIKLAKDIKADGIEANYLYYNAQNELFDEVELWRNVAKDNNLIASVGSDYHMRDGITCDIGFSNKDFVLEKREVEDIVANILDK